jgi:pSer/pThr/pTyr-binding forkhead associated (FHA) protein
MFRLDQARLTIGRDEKANLMIQSPEISRIHAELTRSGSGLYMIADNNSTNGTFLNGQKVQGAIGMEPGDMIEFGDSIILSYEVIKPV